MAMMMMMMEGGLDSGEFGHMRDMIADRADPSARHCLCQADGIGQNGRKKGC